uniref:Uncharacterized protein n=1 Tax=Caenorhabditis japonica TaxID=281687 RepID=A0A8R1DUA6_CAEJA
PIYTSDPISVAEENYEWDEEEEEEEDVPLNEGVVWDHPLEQARREQARQEQEDEDEFNLGAEDEDEEDVRLDAGAGVEEQEQQEDEVERAGPAPRRIPLMIRRRRPRDPRVDPPVMEEIIQANDPILYPNLGRHPRADQYPANFSRAMVAYAEDPFWTQRIVPLPPDIPVPPRPRDYFIRPERTPTPEDFNFVPPDMPPPIDIPPEAWAAREERRQRYEEEQRHQNQNQNR